MNHTYPFKGKFKDLKKQGYKFWKAFASNYKVYTKKVGGRDLHVWVAHGGYIEYGDLYSHSANFFEAIKNLKDDDYRTSSLSETEYAYVLFDWDNMDVKPEVHKWALSHRVLKTLIKNGSEGLSAQDQVDEMQKIKKELYGERDMYEVCITKCQVKEILEELNKLDKS